MDINTLSQTQTAIYSFTAGYMVSQLNLFGFVLGCGFMLALQYIPYNTILDKLRQQPLVKVAPNNNNNLWEKLRQTTAILVGESSTKGEGSDSRGEDLG